MAGMCDFQIRDITHQSVNGRTHLSILKHRLEQQEHRRAHDAQVEDKTL
jgi:hypothetical protein